MKGTEKSLDKSFKTSFSETAIIIFLTMSEHTINLAKLKELIRNGITAIPKDEEAHEAVIVIGDTGVGKSTILNFLDGR